MSDDEYSNAISASDRPAGPSEAEPGASPNYGAMAAVGIGGAASAFSQYQSGRINQRIARYNAERLRVQAEQSIQAGDFAARRRQMVQEQLSGRTIANQAAGGTVVGAGTSRLVTAGQASASAMDQFLIRMNASRQAESFDVKAAGEEFSGDMAKRTGESGAIGSLLNTGSNEWLLSDSSFDPRFGRGVAVGGGGG